MKFKLDENLDVRLAGWLETLGHDAETVYQEKLSAVADELLFEIRKAEGRVLITLDLDFSDPIRFSPVETPGTIVLRPHVPSMGMIRLLVELAIHRLESEPVAGRSWIVEPGRIRMWESWDI